MEQVQGSASTSKTTSEADGFFGAGFLALGAKKLRTSPPADDALRLAGAERRFVGGARCGGGGGGFGASGARGAPESSLFFLKKDWIVLGGVVAARMVAGRALA